MVNHILDVIRSIPHDVDQIYVIDDACPDHSGQFVQDNCKDSRVKVLCNELNLGVGGAVKLGYRQAIEAGAKIIVKLDGDGQMDPSLIPMLIAPIQKNQADYTKGNRFFRIEKLAQMPFVRLIGNSTLSFINKAVSGYWSVMDPTNGFTAIHKTALSHIPLEKIDNRYFFESDMLFRLGTISAVVKDIPMDASYGTEISNLSVWRVLFGFPFKYLNRFLKRIFYAYFLREFNIASVQLILGGLLFKFGALFGAWHWYKSITLETPASTGTVMVATLPIILGFQLLLAALHIDIQSAPTIPLNQTNEKP